MRGNEQIQEAMFSYVSPAQRVPQDHPLRPIRKMVDEALKELSPKFERMYSDTYGASLVRTEPARGVHQFRRNSCCGRCCCSRSTPFAASGC